MKIISFDPSFTKTGWANFDDQKLVSFGSWKLNPSESIQMRLNNLGMLTFDILFKLDPDLVVIEVSSGKVNPRRHGGRGAGMASYGMGVGVVVGCSFSVLGVSSTHLVQENQWTRGVPKSTRITVASHLYPDYEKKKKSIKGYDTGGDEADALMLFDWWRRCQLMKTTTT